MITHPDFSYNYNLVESGGRATLESTCKKCGASKIFPDQDGSLNAWEAEHAGQHKPKDQTDLEVA